MNHTATAEQIQFYQDNGHVVLDDFLDAGELETWRQYVGEAVAARDKRKLAPAPSIMACWRMAPYRITVAR